MNSLGINTTAKIVIEELEVYDAFEDDNKNIRVIDKSLKKRGYILSSAQRVEILRQREITIDKFSISITDKNLWITPQSSVSMDKKFKELCRVNKIPKKNRAYLKENNLLGKIIPLL